jgi:hypothetical protein
MKKYVIQDVNDHKFLCDDNTWSEDVQDALLLDSMQAGWDKAIEINKIEKYPLTVVIIII